MQNTQLKQRKNFMHAPASVLMELNNLFFELNDITAIKRQDSIYSNKKIKEGLKIDKIKNSLILSKNENIKGIYLTGGEPFLHPDFNSILRMCLKRANTTVITNATLINEKKARFLRKIDDENKFETIYRINISHWEEKINDSIRGYGNFRKVVYAINSLSKYGFNPIINFINMTNETKEDVFLGFQELYRKYNLNFEDINLKFNKTAEIKNINPEELDNNQKINFDCSSSRIISSRGVFACPSLCNDFRARVGSDLSDYTKKIYLDTEKCLLCRKNNNKIFVNDWL